MTRTASTSTLLPYLCGFSAIVLLTLLGARATGEEFAERLATEAEEAIASAGGKGVKARFYNSAGWPSRHPLLSGGDRLDDATRERVARAIAAIPGVGGVHWAESAGLTPARAVALRPVNCQNDVETLLRSGSIRFEEGSARIDATSRVLVDQLAEALHPCRGSIIAIAGHTDSSGSEQSNLALSRRRAEAVRQALIARGIPPEGLRAQGVGSSDPIAGLDPADPANRRIEFSIIASMALKPTPVDTPGPR